MSEEEPTSDVVRRDRFSGGPARGFLSSMADDERIFSADLAVDRAHVVMLAEQGVVDEDEAAAILSALDGVESAGFDALPDGEDVHAAIETAVIERVGDVGGKMHTARSRNDEVATCIRYRLREDVLEAIEATLGLRKSLAEVAAEHTETVMPGYTHLQPAQPTTVAHYLLSYEQAVARDTARLFDAYARVNRSPLGAAAFAGTPFDVDRERTAELLGFDGLVANSMDAVSARDFLVEVVAALANLATTVSGLAEDLVVFSNKGLVELSDDYSSTSSIMPQKKNPDTLELVRATAGDAAAGLNGLLTALKGLPRAYNRDLQNATPHAWETVDAVTEAVAVAAGAAATATWDDEALADAAGEGFSTATGVADLLAMAGVPFRKAHEMVAKAAEEGADYAALDSAAEEVLDDPLSAYVEREAVETALDPAESAASRDSTGGPAPESVAAGLTAAEETVAADEATLADARASLAAAADRLSEEVSIRA
ncbi:argininosuccinate lyase [Halorussus gelatinilyticus]|uniref:Argininosuccinate lyase n=1 Tax=Halorussus gelatinilyticus TaxID=2937524 RepID=A0A8U0IKK7_9EURY|nr:argininosuccinate lyase [Halorussus gelatinilyticus]UPW01670.1 argininosuccinate lyase [Halorussus gelatinilyticus]